MKFLKSKPFAVLLTVVITLSVLAGAALAAGVLNDELGSTVTVLEAAPGVTFYSDAECTTEITTIDFGSVKQGQSSDPVSVYIKNTGEREITTVAISDGTAATFGDITYSVNDFALAIGNVQEVQITFTAAVDASTITTTLTIDVDSTWL